MRFIPVVLLRILNSSTCTCVVTFQRSSTRSTAFGSLWIDMALHDIGVSTRPRLGYCFFTFFCTLFTTSRLAHVATFGKYLLTWGLADKLGTCD